MGTSARAFHPLAVVVNLHPALDQFASGPAGEAFKAGLQTELAALVADLGLPGDLTLSVTSAAELESGTEPCSIIVNSQPAKMPPQHELPGAAAILSRQIVDVVRGQRTLLLTGEICEQVRRQRALDGGRPPESLPGDVAAMCLRRLVAGGWRVDRLSPMPADALDALSAGHPVAARRQLEEVIASLPAPGIRVRLSAGLFDQLRDRASDMEPDVLAVHLRQLSDEVYAELGVVIDPPAVVSDRGLADRQFRLQLNDLRLAVHEAPGTATAHSIIRGITDEARRLVARHAPLLMTKTTVCQLLKFLREREPALVETVESRFDPTVITWILQDLLEDFVSVRDLRNILEALASVEGVKSSALAMGDSMEMADVEYWSNWVRCELTRQIMEPLTVGSTLTVHLLAPDLEARLGASDATPLSDTERQQLVQLIVAARRAQGRGPMIVLTSMEAKRPLRRMIADQLPEVRVISYNEIDRSTNIVPRGRIGGGAPV